MSTSVLFWREELNTLWTLDCRKVKNLLWRFVTKTKSKESSLDSYQVGESLKKFNPELRFINPAAKQTREKEIESVNFTNFFLFFFYIKILLSENASYQQNDFQSVLETRLHNMHNWKESLKRHNPGYEYPGKC